jgi:predicted acetyltransferase
MNKEKTPPRLTYVRPSLEYKAAFQDWLDDWRGDQYDPYRWIFTRAWDDFEWYVELCERVRTEGQPPELTVPLDVHWAFDGDSLVGELYVFFIPLNRDNHIGYKVRPSVRRRGIATALLKHGLEILREQGITEARLACNDANIGSAAVIESCGGRRLADKELVNATFRRYIINLT